MLDFFLLPSHTINRSGRLILQIFLSVLHIITNNLTIRQFCQKYSHFEKIGENFLSFSQSFLMIFVSVRVMDVKMDDRSLYTTKEKTAIILYRIFQNCYTWAKEKVPGLHNIKFLFCFCFKFHLKFVRTTCVKPCGATRMTCQRHFTCEI